MGWWGKLFGKEARGTAMKMAPTAMKEHGKGMARMVQDPVCGMEVDEKTAAGRSEYMGTTYYFCSPGCKKAVDENPRKYVKGAGPQMAGHGSHHM